jgi:hypothetical protein
MICSLESFDGRIRQSHRAQACNSIAQELPAIDALEGIRNFFLRGKLCGLGEAYIC